MRVFFFSERLAPPLDEGIKNVAVNLLRCWREAHEVLAFTTAGADMPALGLHNLPSVSRLLLDSRLRRAICQFQPERICYLPTASMTFAAFLRAAVLARYGSGVPVTMIVLQPREQPAWQRTVISLIAPALIIVQSQASAARLGYLGNRVRFAPAGVDARRFAPVTEADRLTLRRKYGLETAAHVILHVGHINRNRNVQVLKAIQKMDGVQAILAGSASTPQDVGLVEELRASGVRVITDYVPEIQEIYQLADLYLFPAPADAPAAQTPAIEIPLSVLEAMACDLPVVSTRFGGLPSLFAEGPGVVYINDARDDEAWRAGVRQAMTTGRGHTRRLVEQYTWQHFAATCLGAPARSLEICSSSSTGPHSLKDVSLARLAAGMLAPARPLALPPDLASLALEELPAFLKVNKVPLLALPADPRLETILQSPSLVEARRRETELFATQRAEFELVRQAWEAEGIMPVFLKAAGLPPAFPHTSDNLDVYVRPQEGHAARQILRRLGYVELRNIEEPNKYLFKRFRAGQEVCAIHLHLRLEWSVSFLHEDQFWGRRRPAPDDSRLWVPSPEDALLITIAHSLYENKCVKLGDLARVARCLEGPSLDWDYIWETARSKGWLTGLGFSTVLYDWLDRCLYMQSAIPPAQVERAWAVLGSWSRLARSYLQRPMRFPFLISFGLSKRLLFVKMLRDENEPLIHRLRDVIVHLVTGFKLRSGFRSQPAMLIAFSGVDGSGKTTQAQAVVSAFRQCAIKVDYVWSRGGASPLAAGLIRWGKRLIRFFGRWPEQGGHSFHQISREDLSRHPIVRRLWPWLILVDLAWTYFRRVRWPLFHGRVVISDRYLLDALAEMGSWLGEAEIDRRLPARLLRWIAPRPDRAFYLDVPAEEARRRQPAEIQQGTPELAQSQIRMYNSLLERLDVRRLDGTRPAEEVSDWLVYNILTDYFDNYHTVLNALLLSNPKACSRGGERAGELPPRPAPMPYFSVGEASVDA